MHSFINRINGNLIALNTVSFLTLFGVCAGATAAEDFRLRQAIVGAFGGETAAEIDNPGFFGTAILNYADAYKVVDENGNNIGLPPRALPLPTGPATKGAIPSGTYTFNVPAGAIDFKQWQTQLNLLGGYQTEDTYAEGRLAFVVDLPLIKTSRSVTFAQPPGTVSPTPPSALSPTLRGAIASMAGVLNNRVQASVAADAVNQNAEVTGLGDAELSMLWSRQMGRLKVVSGMTVFVPTGDFDKTRGPNPGYGNFYTFRPGIAASYLLNPNQSESDWDEGVTVSGRISYGINTTNKDTNYRSGNFVYIETAAVKVKGNWGFGANLLGIKQVTDDSGTAAPANGDRYMNDSFGPFLAYKIPGKDAGFNLHFSHNFGSRNAVVANTIQCRFIKAW